MTRETKVGLVVASSFLCLVGVVVASKLRQGDSSASAASTHSSAPAALAENVKTPDIPGLDSSKKKGPVTPANFESRNGSNEVNLPPLPPSPTEVSGTKMVLPTAPKFEDVQKKVDAAQDKFNAVLKSQVDKVNNTKLEFPPLAQADPPKSASTPDVSLPPPPPAGLTAPKPAADIPPPPPVSGLKPPTSDREFNVPPPIAPPETKPGSLTAPAPLPLPGQSPPAAPNPATAKSPVPTPPGPVPTPAPPTVAPPAALTPPAASDLVNPQPPLPTPTAKDPTPPPPPPGRFENKQPTVAPPPPVAPPAVAPPIPMPTPTPAPTNPSIPGAPPAPLGAVPPPLGAAANPGSPKVNKYDVEPYICKPEDTSFAVISKRVYGTDRYARALWVFNREHPRAPANIQQDPPRLQAGQQIFVPPSNFLDLRYAQHIGNGAAPPNTFQPADTAKVPVIPQPAPAAPVAPVGPVGVAVPLANSTSGPGPLSVRTPASGNTAPADPAKTYRVKDPGQHIMEIAQQTLGDSRRWNQIYQLNQSLQPQFPIPGGTVIRLP